MKVLILVASCVFSISVQAQITLEKVIRDTNSYFSVARIDSGEYYYVVHTSSPAVNYAEFTLYDLNFNEYKRIPLPGVPSSKSPDADRVQFISRRLFDLDDSIEFLWQHYDGTDFHVSIIKESGNVIFSCAKCLGGLGSDADVNAAVANTPGGTKLLIRSYASTGSEPPTGNMIYSLPGKLVNEPSAVEDIHVIKSILDIRVMPNPASKQLQISYNLLPGQYSGYVVIRGIDGDERQRHYVNYSSGKIEVDISSLPAGSYFCCLLTDDGKMAVKKVMVVQ
jgi:hypothetical protein